MNQWVILECIDDDLSPPENSFIHHYVNGGLTQVQDCLNLIHWNNHRWGVLIADIYKIESVGEEVLSDMMINAVKWTNDRKEEYRRKEEEAKAEKKRLAEEKKKETTKAKEEKEYELYLELYKKYGNVDVG